MGLVMSWGLLVGVGLSLSGAIVLSSSGVSGLLLEWELFSSCSSGLEMCVLFDNQNLLMGGTVCFIAMNVMMFSRTYMEDDPLEARFNYMMASFVFSMMVLVFVPNLVGLMIGWDGLGVTSFLLIAYYSKPVSAGASMLTFMTNRMGDAFMLISIAGMISVSHWSCYSFGADTSLWPCGILILLGACTKSAQVPFSSWLPAAMAAPTPVSALVHSSTLVTAGVFLLVRLYPFLSSCQGFHEILLVMACVTTLMAGVCAVYEPDMKKLIALSTLSQLGVMMCSVGLGAPDLAMFHLMSHAMFKALLFVCAGNIIYYSSHNQDSRAQGFLGHQTLTSCCFTLASLSLCGIPFLSGFYSKDLILESMWCSTTGVLIASLMLFSTCFTAVYSVRAASQCLWSPVNHPPAHSVGEGEVHGPWAMLFLASGALAWGCMLNWAYIMPVYVGGMWWTDKGVALMVTLVGGFSGWLVFKSCISVPAALLSFLGSMWFSSSINSQVSVGILHKSSFSLLLLVDQGWQEVGGAEGSHKMLGLSGSVLAGLSQASTSRHIILGFVGALYYVCA